MGNKEVLPYSVSPVHSWTRENFLRFGHLICPVEVHLIGDGMFRAQELVRDGYGLVVVSNHFSLRDGPQVIADVICGNELLRTRPILVPIAYHQCGKMVKMMGKFFDIQPLPIVTQETVDSGKDNGLPLGAGKDNYIMQVMTTLKQSGAVILLPQVTRCPKLDAKPTARPLGLLFAQAEKFKLDKVALVFVGVSLKGLEDYNDKKARRYNIWKTYQLNLGPCYTKEEALSLAGGVKNVDQWSFDVLRTLVPKPYLVGGPSLKP